MKPVEVVMTWIGQDGCEWRQIRVPIGNCGYRYFHQKKFPDGVWL